MFLLILGGKFCVLRMCSSPLPVFDQWESEGQQLLQPLLHGQLRVSDLFAPWSQHRIVWTRLLALAAFYLNGQWDTQVEAILAAVLHAGCAVALGAMLIRLLGRRFEDAVLLCLLLLFGLPFDQENTVSGGFGSQYYALVLFASLAIWGLTQHRAGAPGWWVGVGCAVLAWFSVASGAFTGMAVAAWMVLRLWRRQGAARGGLITLGTSLALAAGGFCLNLGVHQSNPLQAHTLAEFGVRLTELLAWPNFSPWLALPAYAPMAWLLWRTLRDTAPTERRGGGAPRRFCSR